MRAPAAGQPATSGNHQRLTAAAVVTITNTRDAVNGDTTNSASLLGNLGPDGISLSSREARNAANGTLGPMQIGFAPTLAGSRIICAAQGDLLMLSSGDLTISATMARQMTPAVHAVRGLRCVVHGFSTFELAGGFGLPLDVDEKFRVTCRMLVAGLRELAANDQPNARLQGEPSAG